MAISEKLVSILLVEDDFVDIMNIQRAFKKNNIINPLHVAHNGVEALELLRGPRKLNTIPKIILLDINMPQMNGIEFLKEIRTDEELKSLHVFIMTTSSDDNDRWNAYQLNVAGYILKPLSFEKFTSSVSILNNYWQLCELPE